MSHRETLLKSTEDIFCWNGPKAKVWLFSAFRGRLLLTTQRLLFLSEGHSGGLSSSVSDARLLGGRGKMAPNQTLIESLNLEALKAKGSFGVALAEVRDCQTVRRWDFAYYLRLNLTVEGEPVERALMTKSGLASGLMDEWVAAIQERSVSDRFQG